MPDPITLPAADFPDVIREGCALVLTREYVMRSGLRRDAGHRLTATGNPWEKHGRRWVDTSEGAVSLDALAIDLTRPSGQWAVAMWLLDVLRVHDRGISQADKRALVERYGVPVFDIAMLALVGRADPAELRRVALEVRGG